MQATVFTLLKFGCLCLYAGALAGLAGWLPPTLAGFALPLRNIVALMLLVHVLELAPAFPYVRRYPGSLATSIVLALLFGVLHWLPLKQTGATAPRT